MVSLKKIAVIVAAGKGLRLGESVPKQFLLLDGKPLLHWSIQRFSDCGAQVVVVLDKSMESFWNQMAFDFHTPQHFCVFGGKERYHSVRNAINALEDQPAVVAIHDAARPNISCELINLLFQQASKNHSAIPFTTPVDTIRVKEGSETTLIDRSKVMLIQTPQCFLLSDLKDAYQQDYQESFTDDASVMERYLSEPLHFVEGEKLNFKITHPSDWEIMQKIFKP